MSPQVHGKGRISMAGEIHLKFFPGGAVAGQAMEQYDGRVFAVSSPVPIIDRETVSGCQLVILEFRCGHKCGPR